MPNSDPRDGLFYLTLTHMIYSYSLGKPRDAKRRSSGRIFLSYPHTHDRFLYSVAVALLLLLIHYLYVVCVIFGFVVSTKFPF